MTALRIVTRPISEVVVAPWNPRTAHDVEGIAESIRVNGFRDPIEVWAYQDGKRLDDPHITVAGAGRLQAAQLLGLDTVPVIEHDFASEIEAKRYSIANNRETDKSRFDEQLLREQLVELAELDMLAGSGFDGIDPMASLGDEEEFRPVSADEQSTLDREYRLVKCPNCGATFNAKEAASAS